MLEWDPGPSANIAAVFELAPIDEYKKKPKKFRLEWGPLYYRGRTDGSAKVLVIGQDPAADEDVARRILVGTAGQRVQGFLSKLGITSSYIMINAFLYSIYGQFNKELRDFMDSPTVKQWNNQLLASLATAKIEAILAFGKAAEHMVTNWPGAAALEAQGRIFNLTHPTATLKNVFQSWNDNLPNIANKLSPDSDGIVNTTPYSGTKFKKTELQRIPLRDFGFGAPDWMGTGDMAARLKKNGAVPEKTKTTSTILWWALG